MDAAVIGGRDRWARRLQGLEREFELRLESLADEDEAQRSHVEPATGAAAESGGLRAAADRGCWMSFRRQRSGETGWIAGAAGAQALRSPDGVLAVLAEFEPMGDVGPVTVEEVAQVLSERLRFLRPEPPERRWGRVFVGSIEEARGCEFRVVFLPGLAEGLFPQRAWKIRCCWTMLRKELSRDLPLRARPQS